MTDYEVYCRRNESELKGLLDDLESACSIVTARILRDEGFTIEDANEIAEAYANFNVYQNESVSEVRERVLKDLKRRHYIKYASAMVHDDDFAE